MTGHSKGGALTSLGAWLLFKANLKPEQAVSFASPHTGNAAFASAYDSAIDQIRYENYLDMVPWTPPEIEFFDVLANIPGIGGLFKGAESWNYKPVGKLQYIYRKTARSCRIPPA